MAPPRPYWKGYLKLSLGLLSDRPLHRDLLKREGRRERLTSRAQSADQAERLRMT